MVNSQRIEQLTPSITFYHSQKFNNNNYNCFQKQIHIEIQILCHMRITQKQKFQMIHNKLISIISASQFILINQLHFLKVWLQLNAKSIEDIFK
ncbi:unnamed protein product [Paramecium octaurelia]|uniref:Uncharacterized protein n=1 Tax=Paramecium octaurelia TaxID=43137 RepID=A0A8S1VC25_PAROT|nr:unnamed protein product [Paramecium octaurelia]